MEFLCLEVDLQSKKLLLCNILCRQTADSFHNIEEGGPPILCYRKFSWTDNSKVKCSSCGAFAGHMGTTWVPQGLGATPASGSTSWWPRRWCWCRGPGVSAAISGYLLRDQGSCCVKYLCPPHNAFSTLYLNLRVSGLDTYDSFKVIYTAWRCLMRGFKDIYAVGFPQLSI